MSIYFMFLLLGQFTVQCLPCNEVFDTSKKKQLTSQELSTISPQHINDCLQYIAGEPLKIKDAEFIWKTLIDYYGGISNIPENILAQLHWVTVAIRVEDYANITIGTIDVVRNFGLPYNLDNDQLDAIAERVRQDFSGKSPYDYTYYDLKALNQILCAFNRSEIEMIHPSAYRETALCIGKLEKCQDDVLIGFANLATHKDAFGPIENWTGLIWKNVGNVAEYLNVSEEIKNRLQAEKEKIDKKDEST